MQFRVSQAAAKVLAGAVAISMLKVGGSTSTPAHGAVGRPGGLHGCWPDMFAKWASPQGNSLVSLEEGSERGIGN